VSFDDAEPASASAQERDADTGIPIDQWKRYRIPAPPEGAELRRETEPPVPATAKVVSWTRATTVSTTMEYTGNLTNWQLAKVAEGMGMRPDLAHKARGADGERRVLDEVAAEALVVSGATSGSNLGTGMHGITTEIDGIVSTTEPGAERTEALETLAATVHPDYVRDLQAYYRLITDAEHPVIDYPGFDELVVVHPMLKIAGRFDKVRMINGELAIVDVKTARERPGKYGQIPIAMQLAIYSRAPLIYDPKTNTYRRMSTVSQRNAYVIWAPAGQGYAELIKIDISTGWRWVEVAMKARESRNIKGLYFPVSRAHAPEAPEPAQDEVATEESPNLTPVPSQSDGDATGTGKRRRRCGKCGEYGHNARTCPGSTGQQPEQPDEQQPADERPEQSEQQPEQPADEQPEQQLASEVFDPPENIEEMIARGRACVCMRPDGWSVVESRPDVTVCGRCGLPSEATLVKVLGERRGIRELRGEPEPDFLAEMKRRVKLAEEPPPGTPPGTPKGQWPWHAKIEQATTGGELSEIFRSANAAGEWDEQYMFPHAQERYERLAREAKE
jgi:hypothetical protein